MLIAPLSGLSIALVISVADYGGSTLPWVTTAVIGGAIVTEVLVHFVYSGVEDARASTHADPVSDPVSPGTLPDDAEVDAAIDDLEEESGPVYRDAVEDDVAGGQAPGTGGEP